MKDFIVWSVLTILTAILLSGIVVLKAAMLMVVTNWWAGSAGRGFWDAAVVVVVCQILFGTWQKGG